MGDNKRTNKGFRNLENDSHPGSRLHMNHDWISSCYCIIVDYVHQLVFILESAEVLRSSPTLEKGPGCWIGLRNRLYNVKHT